MRVNLPYCGFKNCRYSFDGNCTKTSEQGKCDYWYLLHEELPSSEPETPSNGSITCVKSEKMHDRTMGDLIRRQEAKDAIDMALDHIDHVPPWVYDKLLNALNEVPSAEKAQLSEEDATKDATSDLIKRQDAIDEVEDTDWYHQNKKGEMVHGANPSDHQAWYKAEDIYKVLESLPSAEPETIRCYQCKYAEIADKEDDQDGYTCQFHRGSIWFSGSYCSWAERRTDD